MPIAFSTRYYFIKNTLTTATLDGKPALNANNYLQLTTTNQTIDWNSANKLVITRTSATDITFNQDSIFNHKIYCSFDRNCEITFGFRRFANGVQISSNDTKVLNFVNDVVTAVDIQLISNLLAGNTLYPAGTVFTDEIFISQDTPSTIISKYYCGVNIGGVDYYSWHSLSTPATSLNTDQIADLAITKPKLSQDTYNWIDDKVNKSGDTMTGNLNMSGNSFENAGFEVVTSLPTTNNFVGRQVTYQGRSYIWDGSAWKCNSVLSNTIAFTTLENTKFINHNLGYYPNIQVVDNNGNIVQVDKQHIDTNSIYLSWAGGINGNIILN